MIGRCKSRDHKRHAEDDGEQAAWNVEVEEKRQRVDGEERKPAADERSHHDAENERGPPLASTSQLPLGSQYKTRGEMGLHMTDANTNTNSTLLIVSYIFSGVPHDGVLPC